MDLYGSFRCRFMSELPSNKFKRFLLFLACVDISRITFNEQIPTIKTLQFWLYSICFRFACTQTFYSFLLVNRRAHDHDSVVLVTSFTTPIFSQGHKRYYDFEFYSVASENQPYKKVTLFPREVLRDYKIRWRNGDNARASHVFVHFSAAFTRLRRENA